MDAAIWTRLADQLPVTVLFAMFVIYWTDRLQKSQDRRDELARQGQDKRDETMRQFWKEQQDQNREMMRSLITMLEDHDRKTDEAVNTMKERTRPRGKTS